jgi:hypothetical protein
MMKQIYIIMSAVGLTLTLLPSLLLFFDVIEPGQMNNYILIGTVLWFSGAIPWLGKKRSQN